MLEYPQMATLEFGLPKDFDQAIVRLPERNNPKYKSDQVVEHLVHFREELIELFILNAISPKSFKNLSLDDRLIPLKLEDLNRLEETSFKRIFRQLFL